MKKSNSYFQLIIKEDGTYLRIIPGDNGEITYNVEELIRYIEKNNIHDYNIKDIGNAIKNTLEPTEILLAKEKIYPVNETVTITITENKFHAIARFYAPSNLGNRLTKDQILYQLNNAKVKYGIDEKVISEHLTEPRYCEDIILATGKKAENGKNAFITYYFDTDLKVKPKHNEDGTVDFHQLNNISHIEEGAILARLTPEVPGVSGTDVYGNEIRPPKVERKILRYGKNITLSEDGLTIISQVNGHATLVDDKVFVYNTYEVPGDVDTSTGDIEYQGNIYIKGNVRSGFKVKALGNIEINGVVEAAEVSAGGNIILKRGIQGMGKGLLTCGGNLVAKFIESSTALVDGYIHTESILHSKVAAVEEVLVEGHKGMLIGGHIRSTCNVQAKTIGSAMGTMTVVEVGNDPKAKDKLNEYQKIIKEKSSELDKLRQICDMLAKKNELGLLDKEKKILLIKMINSIKLLKQEIDEKQEEINKIFNGLRKNNNATIKVIGDIHPGVKLMISDEIMIIDNKTCHCQYKLQNGEMVSVPL